MLVGPMICPFDIKTRKFSYYNARKQGLPTDSDYVRYIEGWAQVTLIVPPRMDEYIAVNMEIQRIFQNYGSQMIFILLYRWGLYWPD